MKLWKWILIAFAAVVVTLSLMNASWLAPKPAGSLVLVAHRGITHAPREGAEGPCPQVQMASAGLPFIENSIPGMREAVRLGARAIAMDVRRTADGRLVVFRDETLDCRTNGSGPLAERTLAELKALDIGHAYTADGGETFPLRGRGIGGMPTVEDVLYAFRNERLIFVLRTDDPRSAEAMAAAFRATGSDLDERIGFVGPEPVLSRMRALAPEAWSFRREESEACLDAYPRLGWLGVVPEECRDTVVALTPQADWRLWGWPYRFFARLHGAGTELMAIEGYDAQEMPRGLITAEQLGEVPRDFAGWLWVEDMSNVGRALIR